MKNSELVVVGLVVSLAGYGGFSLGKSSVEIPAPEPVAFAINLPPGLVEMNAPLLQMDCDRDPEVTFTGSSIDMSGDAATAISMGDRDGE